MATKGVDDITRDEWHHLLMRLKTTVEGLLATPSSNVWSTYGGLQRLCKDVEQIMNHRLTVTQTQYGSTLDFWNFVRGLRWLNPTLAPAIEQYHKLTRGGATSRESPLSSSPAGRAWLRQSLLEHNLSGQLQTLVGNTQHLHQHYYEDGFLCQEEYFAALLLCLHAVEQNRVALLADISPAILSGSLRRRNTTTKAKSPLRVSHVRSASLPVNQISDSIMIRRSTTGDHLTPPLLSSPKTDSVLTMSHEHARVTSSGSSPEESATQVLRQVLHKSCSYEDTDNFSFYNNPMGTSTEKLADPLMNMQIIPAILSDNSAFKRKASLPSTKSNRLSDSKKHNLQAHNARNNHSTLKSSHSKKKQSTKEVSKSTELLDSILNSEEGIQIADDNCDGNSAIIDNNLSQRTTSSHKVSDIHALQTHSSRSISNDSGISSAQTTISSTRTDISISDSSHGNQEATPSTSRSICDQVPSKKSSSSVAMKDSHKKSHKRSVSDFGVSSNTPNKHAVLTNDDKADASSVSAADNLSSSLPASEQSSKRAFHDRRRESYFPQPEKGQSLMSFLSSQDFHTCAELDKENAHFSISEALIAAIEQMKWNQVIRPQRDPDDLEEGDSDEEIQQLKQRIRIRRRERMKEKARGFPAFSDGRTDTTTSTTTASMSTPSSSPTNSVMSQDSSSGSGEVHDAEINDDTNRNSNLTSLKESGLSLSLASLYSDADLQKSNASLDRPLEGQFLMDHSSVASMTSSASMPVIPVTFPTMQASAESVAISLIKRFSEKQLPKASDLEWLVSEQDAPQALLPLPDSYPVSPDDSEHSDLATATTRIRGNLEWAPPRAQIIFNTHPPPKRKVILAKQNFRCAGCGAKVETGYMKRYRYCEYLGKYFCPCCHSNDLAYIPGRILRKWDFTKYYVANFSRDLINRIFNDPLFNIQDINQGLYRKVRVLDQVREWRQQLQHLRSFLATCRNGFRLLEKLDRSATHWLMDINIYSLHELVKIKKQELIPELKQLVNECVTHVSQCQLCQAKGFICETCNNANDIIFPFELQKVAQCLACRACYHKVCFNPDECRKCARIEARKAWRAKQDEMDEER